MTAGQRLRHSDCITQGIRVKVRSYYVPSHSSPSLSQFFFAYDVSISNESDKTVQVRSRHWIITNGQGRVEEVKGPGVVGEQPILRPGESFEYTSACPLQTSYGTMEGSYETAVFDRDDGNLNAAAAVRSVLSPPPSINVKIGRFALNAVREQSSLAECEV
ncbi:ApaG domain-containing protein [Chloropicon primus]|uniref:ApaG domain-containing protein n=1 Tax=Chloropicon primus TaxID=1764295 RepID=A0A5B8MS52_9CHLO|nr:ApaG domain-containing protein [Chloropicon primus]UPR02495.1 ApaG domain-containing protein [Chloropicon primus]|eukprot:QDZ23283.1 ApaG domain-containing protein [Chloropicon primus]